jgi:hypothetical protein
MAKNLTPAQKAAAKLAAAKLAAEADAARNNPADNSDAAPAHEAATKAQGESKKVTSAGEKVVVASKLQFPLRIRNFRMVNVTEQRPNAPSKEISQAEALLDTFVVHGVAKLRGAGRADITDNRRMNFGYAFTEGIDKESYDRWAHDNKDQPFMTNKLVFAMPDLREAEAKAKDNEKRITMHEPIDPAGDTRTNKNIETANKR